MDSSSIGMIVALVICISCSAYFSATETAFTSINSIRMKTWAENGDRRAARTLALAANYDKLLSSILIGNNIVNISASTIATVLFTKIFLEYGPTISTIVITLVVLIFGEISPKSLAKEYPEKWAMMATPSLGLIIKILTPLNFFFSLWKKLLSKVFHTSEDAGITEEELVGIVNQAESEGGLDQHEGELIRASIEFNDLDVDDILTPRVDLAAVDENATMEEVAALFAETGYSRLPIYHDTIDNIIGVVHQKDFYRARTRGETLLAQVKSPVIYTTPNTKIFKLLRTLQHNKVHMAVVVDEYGGTEGIVTMEDIIEELVGEIWDEHDEVVEEFHKQADGAYVIDCAADLDDMYDLFQIKGECEASTVSGWVLEQIDRIPKVGDHFTAEGLEVRVTKVDHRRVMEICVRPLPPAEDEDDE
ncbi:MAG: hemolysin family protein [Peptococcaceae bacterium]|nr:hemolysin family protein [Peptococcaceae bacterium]